MSTQIDLTGQADVYSETPRTTTDKTAGPAGHYAISVTVEYSPMALSRVFGLIGMVSMVPALSRISHISKGDDEIIDVFLEFSSAHPHKFDLLCRKLNQLTETVSLQISDSSAGN